jgi:hypothetical protein
MADAAPWDVDGYFVGTVQGFPVNAIFRFRGDAQGGVTEVDVHAENDPDYQSTVSRAPAIEQMREHVIQQLHRARQVCDEQTAADPALPTSARSPITYLHDYQHSDRAAQAGSPDPPAAGQARSG